MKINTNAPLTDFSGNPVKENDKIVTVKTLIINALMGVFQDEQGLTGEEKFRRYMIAEKVYKADGEVEISLEEAAEIKKLVGKSYSPIAVGFIFNLLENK